MQDGTCYFRSMALADTLLQALSTATNIKDALSMAFNRCEVGSCAKGRNLSLGVACVQCERFVCNAHGFVPLNAIPMIVQSKKPVVLCLECIRARAEGEETL